MWRYEKVAVVKASRLVVWEWWSNVEQWPQWDIDLSESALLGELAVGTQGKMKVADDALISFVVSEVIPEERLVIKVALFGATLSYSHAMVEEDGQLRITHGATITGIFGIFWRLLLKKKIEKTLQPALDALAAQVVAETARRNETAPVAPVVDAAEQDAGNPAAPIEAAEEPKVAVPVGGGDQVENELRAQDVHTQIEVAAHGPEVTLVKPVEPVAAPVAEATEAVAPEASTENHTAVVAVSPVITKKETKRSKE